MARPYHKSQFARMAHDAKWTEVRKYYEREVLLDPIGLADELDLCWSEVLSYFVTRMELEK